MVVNVLLHLMKARKGQEGANSRRGLSIDLVGFARVTGPKDGNLRRIRVEREVES